MLQKSRRHRQYHVQDPSDRRHGLAAPLFAIHFFHDLLYKPKQPRHHDIMQEVQSFGLGDKACQNRKKDQSSSCRIHSGCTQICQSDSNLHQPTFFRHSAIHLTARSFPLLSFVTLSITNKRLECCQKKNRVKKTFRHDSTLL